jgi:aminoglycoside phosphotransferase family enzyme/gluconate kinase
MLPPNLKPEVTASPSALIHSLQEPSVYDHEVKDLAIVETHISWVVLTGPYAYKIKKPVNLGFLDFSTLDKRHYYCKEELRLNRRLAPLTYVDVVTITGTPQAPVLNGTGPPLEYAVQMVQFPQHAQLDRVLARHALTNKHIYRLAQKVAAFHNTIDIADKNAPYGTPERVHDQVMQNFAQISSRLGRKIDIDRLDEIRNWTETEYNQQLDVLRQRKRGGFIRECHGDMHLRNIALVDNELLIFDCIEFSDDLRWVDVMSEVAFIVMDFQDRHAPNFARHFLNAYLEFTGDYAGLAVLRYYLSYRAMVRAMVSIIRSEQTSLTNEEKERGLANYGDYIALALRYTTMYRPALIITHGLSGCGKTTVAQSLLENQSMIRLRSDIERKRLHGLPPDARSGSTLGTDLYRPEVSQKTYAHLAELSSTLLESGFTVVVDAAFLKRAERYAFRALAERLGVPFAILDCQASEETLLNRIATRERQGHDASEANAAVLTHQLATHEPLTGQEKVLTLTIETTHPVDGAQIVHALRQRMNI